MGFDDISALYIGAERIAGSLDAGDALTREGWARALIATEFAFASDFYGSGWDWSIAAGYDDETTIRPLRAVQRTLVGIARLP